MKSGPACPPNVWGSVSVELKRNTRICLVPRLAGVGGMVSFQYKLADGLRARGIQVCQDLSDTPCQAVLVIGGTRDLAGLWRLRRQGIPVVQRLDGMNWLHRLAGIRKDGWRHYLRAEYGNRLLALIRSRLASRVVYQSEFARSWWERVYGALPLENRVIHNGVDLNCYSQTGIGTPPTDRWRLLMVEGSLMGGYELGLHAAVDLSVRLAGLLSAPGCPVEPRPVELLVAGRVSESVRRQWQGRLEQARGALPVSLSWAGLVPLDQIPQLDRSAHLLYSSDINPACPNSVIEALACGLPVIAFDTGALPEMLSGDCGRVVPYGGDPWKLETPDIAALAQAALSVLADQPRFRNEARLRAETVFGLDQMVESYLDILLRAQS
jgi:glycosyltransferase involved in cell wall biosynthesis